VFISLALGLGATQTVEHVICHHVTMYNKLNFAILELHYDVLQYECIVCNMYVHHTTMRIPAGVPLASCLSYYSSIAYTTLRAHTPLLPLLATPFQQPTTHTLAPSTHCFDFLQPSAPID
jgi:hypothetical protein